MTLRFVHSPRTTTDAVRRARAVLGVFDQDLTRLAAQLADPVPSRVLSEAEWDAAEAARVTVERDLRGLEAEAAVISAQANDWRAKATLANQRGDMPLAEQAQIRAAQTAQLSDSYRQEINAVRAFLQEWAVRVTRAPSGCPSSPLANERER
jgi:hypothetical protein